MDVVTDAAAAVLGSMLIDESVVPTILSMLDPQDFTSALHRTLFEAIRALYRAGEPVDAITATDRAGWSQDAERRAFVAELLDLTPTSANATEYARILHEQAVLASLRTQAELVRIAPTLDECRAPVTAMTDALAAGQRIEARSLGEMLIAFGDAQLEEEREYIALGFEELDANTYLERGDMLILGAAPSDGKTALALQMAYTMSARYNVGFFSLETRWRKLVDRLVASGMGISFDAIKKHRMTQGEWDTFAAESAKVANRRLTVLQAAGITADQIAATSRARGFEVIFIDYGQLITPQSAKNASRAEQMADVSRTLHTFAQTTGTLVVLLLQLIRRERGSKRERDMFDLAESSQFERDADLVLLLYRPEKWTRLDENDPDSEELDPERTRILRIAKQKEGMRVRLPMAFDGDTQRFSVLAPDGRAVMRKLVAAGREAKDRNHHEAMRQQGLVEIEETGEEPF